MRMATFNDEPSFDICDYCNRCGVMAVVFCDQCQTVTCFHLSERVGKEALCHRCLKEPPRWASWFFDS